MSAVFIYACTFSITPLVEKEQQLDPFRSRWLVKEARYPHVCLPFTLSVYNTLSLSCTEHGEREGCLFIDSASNVVVIVVGAWSQGCRILSSARNRCGAGCIMHGSARGSMGVNGLEVCKVHVQTRSPRLHLRKTHQVSSAGAVFCIYFSLSLRLLSHFLANSLLHSAANII